MAQPRLAGESRRRHPRWRLPDDGRHVIDLRWPSRSGRPFSMALHDLSPSGLSFRLEHELPGIEVCSPLRGVVVQLGEVEIRADLVVIHLTSRPGHPTVCGTLVYPATDDDLRALRAWLEAHDPD